ncbi:hypothetical protein HNR33_000531 [Brassicibacter mesophilus]
MRNLEIFPIDECIVKLSSKIQPKVLFISTASGDAQGYID